MLIEFSNKVIVITGAASGIGWACSRLFIDDGADVVLLDIKQADAKDVLQLGGKAFFLQCDVSDGHSVKTAFEQIAEKYGRVDVLVNNAGIQSYGNVTDTSEEDWDRTMNVNVKSIFLCSKYAIPLLMKSVTPVIVNVASVKSFVCQDNEVAYVTSKSSILGLTRSIATDYAPRLRCVAVCPGAISTPLLFDEINKSEKREALIAATEDIHLLKRIGAPEEVANFILFLASEKAGFATGQAYRVDGGIGVRIEGI